MEQEKQAEQTPREKTEPEQTEHNRAEEQKAAEEQPSAQEPEEKPETRSTDETNNRPKEEPQGAQEEKTEELALADTAPEPGKKKSEAGAITAQFTLPRGFLFDAFQKTDKKSGEILRHRIFIIVLVLFAIDNAISIPRAEHKALPTVLALVCILMVLLILYVGRTANDRITEALHANGAGYTVAFNSVSFVVDFPGERREVAYHEKVKIYDFPAFYSIKYRDNRAFVVPKSALTQEQQETLSRFLMEKLGSYYKAY